MNRRPYGSVLARALAMLEREGPMTAIEIAMRLGVDRRSVGACLWDCTRTDLRSPHRFKDGRVEYLSQRAHVPEWTREVPGVRYCPRPVFAAGPGPVAPKPRRLAKSVTRARYYATRGYALTLVAKRAARGSKPTPWDALR